VNNNIKIPLYLLTNGGGCTEKAKAESLNKILGSNLERKQIFLNYTPLRPIMK
jgi:ribonucleotide monophosphatase NagD (HAD superfamily)